MRKAVNAVIIKEGKILLFRKNLVWILPGGKPELGENDLETLAREFREEALGAELDITGYYGRFLGITPHSKDFLRAYVYFARRKSDEEIVPSGEIEEARFVRDFENYNISDITKKVLNSLVKENYL